MKGHKCTHIFTVICPCYCIRLPSKMLSIIYFFTDNHGSVAKSAGTEVVTMTMMNHDAAITPQMMAQTAELIWVIPTWGHQSKLN